MRKKIRKLVLFVLIFSQASYIYLYQVPQLKIVDTANLTSASVTLSNSRLSYRAGVTSGSSGASLVTIDGSGNADNDTNHLFPNDSVCFTDSGINGCIGSTAYSVANIISSTTFNTATALGNDLNASGYAVASQSGSFTISFVTTSVVPAAGDILVTIPMADSASGNDGIPDTNASLATNGFDLNAIAAADISTTGCTDGNWNTTETITAGSGSTDHTIRIDRQTTSCAAGTTVTVTIDASPGIVNPAPITSGHTQGLADTYTINVKTRDGSDNTLDQVDMKVAPVEAVLVSATVDESLSFQVAGVASAQSTCGQTTDITTTAYSVPWGTIAATSTFYEGSQQLTVSTNADAGYSVKIEENDQMGINGTTCDSPAADTADETDSPACIKDTTCGAVSCSESSGYYWTSASSYPGLGISLANVDGTDASWLYDSTSEPCTTTGGGTSTNFCSRQIADQQAGNTKGTIMTNAAQVNSKDIYVCYRLAISGTQPPGYYYNKVKYTATATF